MLASSGSPRYLGYEITSLGAYAGLPRPPVRARRWLAYIPFGRPSCALPRAAAGTLPRSALAVRAIPLGCASCRPPFARPVYPPATPPIASGCGRKLLRWVHSGLGPPARRGRPPFAWRGAGVGARSPRLFPRLRALIPPPRPAPPPSPLLILPRWVRKLLRWVSSRPCPALPCAAALPSRGGVPGAVRALPAFVRACAPRARHPAPPLAPPLSRGVLLPG